MASENRYSRWMAYATFGLCLFMFLYMTLTGWETPFISEKFGFRQTQTALSVSALLKGGPWLAYETPILGPPWSFPFEFPLYQWLVALIVKTGLLPLAPAGRLLGIMFFVASLYPCYRILRLLEFSRNQSLAILCLLCSSAEYLFWTRTIMIESTALALAVTYLWLVLEYIKRELSVFKNALYLNAFIAFAGGGAASVKVTTFLPFICAAFTAAAVLYYQKLSKSGLRTTITALKSDFLFIMCAFVIPVQAFISWTNFCDSVKLQNPLTAGSTSRAMSSWCFGTLDQKLSPETWVKFYNVTFTDILGNNTLLLCAAVALVFCSWRVRLLAFTVFLFSVLHLVVFSNLNLVHGYYAYGHGIFILAAVGMICAELAVSGSFFKRAAGVILFVLVLTCSWFHYYRSYLPLQGSTPEYFTQMKRDIDYFTNPDDVIIVFGWSYSSEPAYYLQRGAVMLQNDDFTRPNYLAIRRNLKDYKIGAVMILRWSADDMKLVNNVVREFGLSTSSFLQTYPEGAVFYRYGGQSGR